MPNNIVILILLKIEPYRRDQPYIFLKWSSGEPDWILDTPSCIALMTFGIATVVHVFWYAMSLLKFCIKEKILASRGEYNLVDGLTNLI